MLVALKESIRFTLQKKDYEGTIAALTEANDTLRTLVSQSIELEPSRQSRVQNNVIQKVQQLTRGIYTSLCASVNCNCAALHGLGLELDPQKAALMDIVNEGHAIKSIFGIAFGSNLGSSTEQWESFHASSASKKSNPPSIPLLPQMCFTSVRSSNTVGLSSVGTLPAPTSSRFTSTTSTKTRQDTSSKHSYEPQAVEHADLPQIKDLCREFVGKEKGVGPGCFGFVTDNTSEFYLSRNLKSCSSRGSTVDTLKEILAVDDPRFTELGYTQKANIAYTLSANLLPLITTPWLERVLNLDNVAFFGEDGDLGGCVYHLDRLFLANDLVVPPRTLGPSCGHQPLPSSAGTRVSMILSLALVLVQVILGRSVKELRVMEQSCMSCLLEQRAAACRKAGTVLSKGGDIYADAVNRCLGNFLSTAHLDDETFSQQYYGTVVAKLEAVVDIVGSCSSS